MALMDQFSQKQQYIYCPWAKPTNRRGRF